MKLVASAFNKVVKSFQGLLSSIKLIDSTGFSLNYNSFVSLLAEKEVVLKIRAYNIIMIIILNNLTFNFVIIGFSQGYERTKFKCFNTQPFD